MAVRAKFNPRHPEKYMGSTSNIWARSSWEIRFMTFCDSNPSVLKWASEEVKIPYIKPTDGRVHYYFPDFIIVYKDKTGNVQREIIEIKPLKETKLTARSSEYDKLAIAINEAKWTAANAFAESHNMKFRIMTEATLFAGGVPAKKARVIRKKK